MISVIIPNYNQERFVSRAIQSVLSQTYPVDEIIVIDDGSTDGSGNVVRSYGDQIRYIWQENRGLAGARNTGIQASRGDLIALLDADDEWQPAYLETMLTFADQNPDASVYYCRAQAIDSEGNALPQIFGGPAYPPEKLYQVLLRANFIIPSTILMRRINVVQAGLFDQNLRSCEDWDLWLRLLPDHKIVGVDDILVRYRIHASSLSANPAGMQNAHRAVVEKHFGLDDGNPGAWSTDKRRAFGGMYRYHAITSIQKQEDWDAGARYIFKAFKAESSLSRDLDLFYELALGAQPTGYRGSNENLTLEENSNKVMKLLDEVFRANLAELGSLKRQASGVACHAIGMCAYNTGHTAMARSYLWQAGHYYPWLWFTTNLPGLYAKSLLGKRWLAAIRKFKNADNIRSFL